MSTSKGDKGQQLAQIAWEGDSLEVLREFPDDVKKDIGGALRMLQKGERPENIRPMKSVGAGVFEIKTDDERAWYRVIYLSKIDNMIYVLHSFEKQCAKTSQTDLNTATTRLKQVRQRLTEEKKHAKKKKS